MDDGAVPGQQRLARDLVCRVERQRRLLGAVLAEQVHEERRDVLRVHLAGVIRHERRRVRRPDDRRRRWWTTISSGRVSSQLPPRSAARSTTTEPGCIASTISVVIRIGARLPGISAVVMTTSLRGDDLEHHLALAAVERLVLGLGVAALVLGVGRLERQLDEPRAEALDLFLDRRPHVVGLDLGAEPPRRRRSPAARRRRRRR